jgi:hypothetical protein
MESEAKPPFDPEVDEILSGPASSWDRRIAADLIAEMETHTFVNTHLLRR